MAKCPKPVPQMTMAQFEALFPAGDEEACLAIWCAALAGRHPLPALRQYGRLRRLWIQAVPLAVPGLQRGRFRFSCLSGTIFENTKKPPATGIASPI